MEKKYENFLPYIDFENAMSRFANNKSFYIRMLKKFLEDQSLYFNLLLAFDEKDASKAQYNAHSIKGLASNLSLVELYKKMTPFEAELKLSNILFDEINDIIFVYNETIKNIKLLINLMDEGV